MSAKVSGLGRVNVLKEFKLRAWEFVEPAKFLGVGVVWTALDLVGHQLFHATEGEKTPPMYYGGKLLWSIPFLLSGRLLSDHILGGPAWARALTIGTTANSLMQVRYLLSGLPGEFNAIVFLLHEAILFPLSFLLVGDKPVYSSIPSPYEKTIVPEGT